MTAVGAEAHDWRIVAPWYRWALADGSDPERGVDAARPAFHKYTTTEFVTDFLRDPQESVAFDSALDVVQRVEPIPGAQLKSADGRLKSLSSTRLVPTSTRKLFLSAHQRFYLVAIGLHCDRAGFPMVDPAKVSEVGFVIRRRRAVVPDKIAGEGLGLVHELRTARATAQVKMQFDAAAQRSQVLHPFRSRSRDRVVAPRAATVQAAQQVELARRRLRTWAATNDVGLTSQGWVSTGEGTFGQWVAMPDEPEELIERAYPMRLLRPDPGDPNHAAHDGTIYWAVVPTASDEITGEAVNRFNELDTYEIRVFARERHGDCPGPLTWSLPSRQFRVASFYDPTGTAQRPTEIRLPDFRELEASAAMPSVRMSSPAGSSLEFSKMGEIPTKGKVGAGEEICFFSIPLITIIALFVLNLFLPIVVFVFQLWWMLRLKFCIPPSIDIAGDLALELDLEGEFGLQAQLDVDIDVLPGVNSANVAAHLRALFDTPPDAALDHVPLEWQVGSNLLAGGDPLFTNNALFQLALRNGVGRENDGTPTFGAGPAGVTLTTPVRRDQVVHP